MAPNSSQFSARNDAIVIRGVHDVATDTSAETRKLEGKLDALVNLVTQLASNQKPASVARFCGIHSSNDNHTSRTIAAEIRHLMEKLAANQKAASVARVCDMRSYNDHHTSLCPSSQQSGVDEHPEAYAANTYSGLLDRGHTTRLKAIADNTSAETRKLEGKLDVLVNLVTQLAANQKPASVARVCGIRSSNDHHTSVCPSSQQFGVDEHPEAYAANTYSKPTQEVHDVATDTSAETRKLEGKIDSLVNLLTQLAANQKSASIARVCSIRSSNDNHTSACYSSQQSGMGVHDVATDISAETRKLEGKIDAIVNLVTQLAANQKSASVARVCGILSSNAHHTITTPAGETRHFIEKMAPNSEQFSARNDAIVIRGVHDVATDTSAETRKLEAS
ncbi:hypothetical protein Fmac_028508 [Flemingia macrophylla]|uniref:Uncharacterized protein n=1 Tax=Flemingia macrophylla TaxID=520843 RepID=A0ABD1L7P0_9FABA